MLPHCGVPVTLEYTAKEITWSLWPDVKPDPVD
jgi:hypothetical protein